jgi:predicted nucleic acid-binding protein
MEIIVDTTTLSNFLLINRLDILAVVVGEICTTEQVMEEIKMCTVRNVLSEVDLSHVEIIYLTEEDKSLFSRLNEMFGKGEASCLAVCMSRDLKILTDDMDARKFAQRTGIPVSGTIGVLVSATEKGIISRMEADDLLSKMIDKGFYSPIKRLDELDLHEP